jgi:hypothetical protein
VVAGLHLFNSFLDFEIFKTCQKLVVLLSASFRHVVSLTCP